MRQMPKMGMIYVYSGELAWVDGCVAVPMQIKSLKIDGPKRRIYVDFASRHDPFLGKSECYRGSGHAYADQRVPRRELASDVEWLAKPPSMEPIYVADKCWPYINDGPSVSLEWKVRELRDLDGVAYCYAQARWIEHDGESYQSWRCTGLLHGQAEETFTLSKHVDESSSTD